MFSGKSSLFTFLLIVLIMIVTVVIKFVSVVTLTPAKVSGELDEIFSSVEGVSNIQVEFLKEWGDYRISDECSGAVSASRLYSGSGFEGNVYVVTYADSIEFPGFPTFRREFRVERPMSRRN